MKETDGQWMARVRRAERSTRGCWQGEQYGRCVSFEKEEQPGVLKECYYRRVGVRAFLDGCEQLTEVGGLFHRKEAPRPAANKEGQKGLNRGLFMRKFEGRTSGKCTVSAW
ncbi:hypothetical protein GOP47_0003331 [Adiantum capillus-veneris]|uniref:Uncharacterized protein n=1 Tax=Adiantum capillus-veneris TaxID=13818 RepID=A0A9D4ZQ17_ADICA|nr:hypothetical protein GOP47_0003331 [Adiantum capillus-veneris]